MVKLSEMEGKEKDSKINKINEERIEISKKLMTEERDKWESEWNKRLFKSYLLKKKENEEKKKIWNSQLLRSTNSKQKNAVDPEALISNLNIVPLFYMLHLYFILFAYPETIVFHYRSISICNGYYAP